jgi:hypothetical protein
MRTFFATTLKMLPAAVAAWFVGGVSEAQEKTPPPDAATHTVIVPFDSTKPLKDQQAERYYLDYAAGEGFGHRCGRESRDA